ncbi:MAG: helix-turn-helix domain-containing protein, partial [Ktedonobacteraceae bacterium]|nr:helix-turn-helix domain-containing protein [Ktedonobacteraceae bacterium]
MPPNRQLKQEREQRGWSQAHLAEQVGVDVMTVRRWESGFSRPYPIYRERLCTLFGKSVQELGLLPAENEHVESAATLLLDPALPFALGQAADLVGRETFLQDLKQRLFAGDTLALTALNGLPGIGKSALAVALAVDKEVQAHFHDGILWAGLGPQPQVLSLLTRWGAQLGLMPFEVEEASGWESWYRALHARIGVRRFLLIIDDAWSVEDALALQVGGPHCVHLLTTRQPAVALAFAPQVITVQELGEDEGVSLLARFVPQLVEQEAESARALVRAVGGLPLALTLIGRYLAMQRVGGQPGRVHTALAQVQQTQQRMQLSMPVPTQKAQSPSLQATIAISDRRLSALAQATLRALALFPPKPNSFSEEGALAVSGTQVETLDELWDAGMLESSGAGRYTLHQTI